MRGYLYLWRKLATSPLWLSEPFTRGQAWVDMLILANHTDGYIRVRGIRIDIKRGQLAWSHISLAKRWRWSRGKVRRFLSELESEKEAKIVQQNSKVTSLITIISYDIHQVPVQQAVQQTDNRRTTDGTQTINVNNVKKEKTRENDKSFSVGKGDKQPPCPQKKIIDLYHQILPEMTKIIEWDNAASSWLRARWRSKPDYQTLDFWKSYFEYTRQSKFLMEGKDSWSPDLRWLVRSQNFAKVVNGNYHNNKTLNAVMGWLNE